MLYDSERARRVRENVQKGIKPLVTFSVTTYNQEKYIESAVKSALAQTYSPLEILISDDCSSDNTWEIILRTVKEYRGPHTIRLNRNETNLGVTRHCDKIRQMASGDFRTGCAGDDIALPNKVEAMVDRWAQDDYRPIVMYTNGYWMKPDGTREGLIYNNPSRPQTRKEFLRHPITSMPGALAGSSSDIRDIFGQMNPAYCSSEDNITAIRGVLLDHLVYLDVPTMLWRRSGLWTGMLQDRRYDKFRYWNGMRDPAGFSRQALSDALTLGEPKLITAMYKYWRESEYRKDCVTDSFLQLPYKFLDAWLNGGRVLKLLRWTYHAIRYRWLYVVKPWLGLDKTEYAPLQRREVIYKRDAQNGK